MDEAREKRWKLVRRLDQGEPPAGIDLSIRDLANAAWEVQALRDLLPFQSMNRLCFDAGDRPYERPMGGFIIVDTTGRLAVHRGDPYIGARTTVTLETTEPADAIQGLLRVFGWL